MRSRLYSVLWSTLSQYLSQSGADGHWRNRPEAGIIKPSVGFSLTIAIAGLVGLTPRAIGSPVVETAAPTATVERTSPITAATTAIAPTPIAPNPARAIPFPPVPLIDVPLLASVDAHDPAIAVPANWTTLSVGHGFGSTPVQLPPPVTIPTTPSIRVTPSDDWEFSFTAELELSQASPPDATATPSTPTPSASEPTESSPQAIPDADRIESIPPILTEPATSPPLEVDPTPPDEATESEAAPLPEGADPELGILELRERTLDRFKQPVPVYAFFWTGYYGSDNIFALNSPIDDQLLQTSLSLLAYPKLGDRTRAILQIQGGLVSYVAFPEVDYTELEIRGGIRQQLGQRMYGELTWANQQLASRDGGDRFLDEHALRATLFRQDPLGADLTLNSYYRLSWRISDPERRSRVINTAGASLVYDITDRLAASVNSQFSWEDFTHRDRIDTSAQVLAQLSYRLSRLSSIGVYSGFNFGDSTDEFTNLDRFIFGANLSLGVTLF